MPESPIQHEKQLRQNATDAESCLWARLRNRQLGVKFRRQHRLGGYIVDFFCAEKALVIELDGGQHQEQAAYDEHRSAYLEAAGLRVIRFWNHDALARTDQVMAAIWQALQDPVPPHPNPASRPARRLACRQAFAGSQRCCSKALLTPRARGRGSRTRWEAGIAARGNAIAGIPNDHKQQDSAQEPPPLSCELMLPDGSPSPNQSPIPREHKKREHREHREQHELSAPSPPCAGGRAGVRGALASSSTPNPNPNPPTNPIRSSLTLRANLYSTIRSFMAARGVLEVETPILSAGANTEPNIESFNTRFSGPLPDTAPRERWMRTSPEFALKRLLVQGIGDCYELGRVFRDGEAGRRHNPEFTMLEWYRIGWDHHELAEETSDLIERAMALVNQPLQRVRWSYRSLYQSAFGFDPFTAPLEQLKAPLADHGILADDLSRDDWLDLLMTHRLQADFPADALTLVIDFPPSQCALARISGQGDDAVAQRFELYLGDKELANGYHELTDAAEQRARFENDNRRRLARGQRELPIDEHLLAALETGLPECAGVALGIERLLMAMAGTDRIADVLAFAFDQA